MKISSFALYFAFALSVAGFTLGCASSGGMKERYIACPYDTVWNTSVTTMKEYPVSIQDKEKGRIETDWVEFPAQGSPYGLFQREGIEEKERLQFRVDFVQKHDVTILRVTERREHWGFRGGARIYQWYPVQPPESSTNSLLTRLTEPLERQGCLIET